MSAFSTKWTGTVTGPSNTWTVNIKQLLGSDPTDVSVNVAFSMGLTQGRAFDIPNYMDVLGLVSRYAVLLVLDDETTSLYPALTASGINVEDDFRVQVTNGSAVDVTYKIRFGTQRKKKSSQLKMPIRLPLYDGLTITRERRAGTSTTLNDIWRQPTQQPLNRQHSSPVLRKHRVLAPLIDSTC